MERLQENSRVGGGFPRSHSLQTFSSEEVGC